MTRCAADVVRAPMVVVDAALDGVDVGHEVPLDADQQHHLGRVLHRRDGDELVLTDGRGRRVAAVLAGPSARLTEAVEVVPAPSPGIVVAHALPKGRGLDEVVRTLAELGVAAVDPVITARTTSRPPRDRAEKAARRWRAIARSAAEQAHSAHVCDVGTPVLLDAYVDSLTPVGRGASTGGSGVEGAAELRIVADPAGPTTLGAVLADRANPAHVRLLVGPEGGLTADETAMLEEAGWVLARAGETVVRSIHAATVLVAATLALVGRYGTASG